MGCQLAMIWAQFSRWLCQLSFSVNKGIGARGMSTCSIMHRRYHAFSLVRLNKVLTKYTVARVTAQ